MLGEQARRVLGLALLLPGGDLGLFARELAVVVLVVVELGVVGLDAFEEEVRRLGEERVDREGEGWKRGRERGRGRVEGFEGRVCGWGRWERVQVGGEEVGVVDCERKFVEDVLITKIGFLKTVWCGTEKGGRVLSLAMEGE